MGRRIFYRSVQNYYYHVQKNCLFLSPCRNITIQGQGVPGVSCRAIFGVREEILIFGEIYTSGPVTSHITVLNQSHKTCSNHPGHILLHDATEFAMKMS